jgi:chaperonin GroEL
MILHGEEARKKILEGINLVANTVKPTLGPQARTAILQGNPPVVINDGVTISKYVSSKDPYVQMGVQLVQNLASKAQSKAGDGTTTACVLAQALCNNMSEEELKNITRTRGLLTASRDSILNNLDKLSKPVKDEDIGKIATIASNNDEQLGSIIAEVFKEVGRDGVVSVEEGHGLHTEYEIREGLELDKGFITHLFANQDNGDCLLEKPLVFVTNKIIRKFQDILPACEYAAKEGRPLFLICRDLQNLALQNILANVIQGRLNIGVIQAPNYGDSQLDELKDITAIVGGRVYSDEADDDLRIVNEESFGSCDRVVIDQLKTTIIGGEGGNVEERIATLRNIYELGTNEWAKESISNRISKLKGGVAVIKVGAGSAVEMRETKERLDDALNATKAALDGGYIVGGGLSIIKATKDLSNPNWIKGTMFAPLNTLLENSNADIDEVFGDMMHEIQKDIGFNAKNGKKENLLKAGIIDPTNVTKSSLSAAFSIALMFLTTEVAVLIEE